MWFTRILFAPPCCASVSGDTFFTWYGATLLSAFERAIVPGTGAG